MAKNELTLEELAKQIYKGAGGMGNVESIVHCMTRVRMKIGSLSIRTDELCKI
ncbi:TPA: PTS transporter subunit EIIB, partial [Enterococcus faecium]|nr:PTS transporter subunit EIIB [Enterococcus faecium]